MLTKESPEPIEKPLSLSVLMLKSIGLSILFTIIMLSVTSLVIGIWGYFQFQKFLDSANLKQDVFISQIKKGWGKKAIATNGYKNVLILGTDLTDDREDFPALTDTMMLFSINLEDGIINTLPLPRDLWNEAYQTKINALYAYGQERYPDQPEQFATEVLEEMTGVSIHHTFIISLSQLQTLINLVDGVEIEVKKGFTDPLYPRAGIDVTVETNPDVLYETITFKPGSQLLSGERALQYIRSRHSEDQQGHDLARGERQQEIIEALLTKLTNYKLLITQPKLAGKLYTFYNDNFSQTLSLPEFVSTGKALIPHRKTLTFTSHQLTTTENNYRDGVLDNPPRLAIYQFQWVYLINDQQRFEEVVQEKLFTE